MSVCGSTRRIPDVRSRACYWKTFGNQQTPRLLTCRTEAAWPPTAAEQKAESRLGTRFTTVRFLPGRFQARRELPRSAIAFATRAYLELRFSHPPEA